MRIQVYSKRTNHTGFAAWNLWASNLWVMMRYYARAGEWGKVWGYYFKPVVRWHSESLRSALLHTGGRWRGWFIFWPLGQFMASLLLGWEFRHLRFRLTSSMNSDRVET
jgi:hypothetical protein